MTQPVLDQQRYCTNCKSDRAMYITQLHINGAWLRCGTCAHPTWVDA